MLTCPASLIPRNPRISRQANSRAVKLSSDKAIVAQSVPAGTKKRPGFADRALAPGAFHKRDDAGEDTSNEATLDLNNKTTDCSDEDLPGRKIPAKKKAKLQFLF